MDLYHEHTRQEDRRQLWIQRLALAADLAGFVIVLALTRGRLMRLGIVPAFWMVAILGHTMVHGIFETRAAEREAARQKAKREAEAEDAHPEGYVMGDDGEVLPDHDDQNRTHTSNGYR